MEHPPVTICIINYNGVKFLKESLSSIFALNYPTFDVMMIDNASNDNSVNYVIKHFPQVKVHRFSQNRGPNPARNFALLKTKNRYLFLLDNDAIVTKDCLSKLMKIITSHPDVVICSPIVIDKHDPSKIQYAVTHIHYIGQAIIEQINEPIDSLEDKIATSTTLNGTALLIDRTRANKIAYFDERMFFGWTDGDYTFRLTAAGLKCIVVYNSKVLHPSKKRSNKLIYHQIKNRWVFILKNYSSNTLSIIFPALLFYEFLLFGFLLLKGNAQEYLSAISDMICTLPKVMKDRKSTLAIKKLTDTDLLRSGDFVYSQQISISQYQRKLLSCVNLLLNLYWKFFRIINTRKER